MLMEFPKNLLPSKEHIRLQVAGQTGTIRITEFAPGQLGEIVYVGLPLIARSFKAKEIPGSVEAFYCLHKQGMLQHLKPCANGFGAYKPCMLKAKSP